MFENIGVGIITYNRQDFFDSLLKSLPNGMEIVIINDGLPYQNEVYSKKISCLRQHKKNLGIAKSKNEAIKYLMKTGAEHIFILEDDIKIKDGEIFNKYIEASNMTGILHFNYAYHGKENRNKAGNPNPRMIFSYGGVKIGLHRSTTAALTYYRRKVIEDVGLMDEFYKNVWEHVDHTTKIIKAGFHPPFGWFADLEESYNFIEELDLEQVRSVNRKSILDFKIRAKLFYYYFRIKNGFSPFNPPEFSEEEIFSRLNEIKNNYGTKTNFPILKIK